MDGHAAVPGGLGQAGVGHRVVGRTLDGLLVAGDVLVHLLLVAHHEAAPLEVPPVRLGVDTRHLQTSPDGLNWTVYPLVGSGNAVLWDGTRYVVVGTSTSLAGQ